MNKCVKKVNLHFQAECRVYSIFSAYICISTDTNSNFFFGKFKRTTSKIFDSLYYCWLPYTFFYFLNIYSKWIKLNFHYLCSSFSFMLTRHWSGEVLTIKVVSFDCVMSSEPIKPTDIHTWIWVTSQCMGRGLQSVVEKGRGLVTLCFVPVYLSRSF